ncbi:MAG: hypothetical protein LBQ76_08205, partial [Candidatus Fibromonas sp.]|nr:hypothetical protein [Candidatus Fibromonas sp.]
LHNHQFTPQEGFASLHNLPARQREHFASLHNLPAHQREHFASLHNPPAHQREHFASPHCLPAHTQTSITGEPLMKINQISLNRLRNYTHFQFHAEFKDLAGKYYALKKSTTGGSHE